MAQEMRREPAVRLPNPGAQPFVAALKTVRFFAVVFFWLAMVCMLAHVAAFISIQWLGVYDEPAAEPADTVIEAAPSAGAAHGPGLFESVAVAAPAEKGAAPAAESVQKEVPRPGLSAVERFAGARQYRECTAALLKPLRAIGILMAILLLVTIFLYLQIALLGRLSGIRPLTSSLCLTLLFLATVVPWHNLFAELQFGSFFDFDLLLKAHAQWVKFGFSDVYGAASYYLRFFALPLLSTVLLALAGVQFASGYRESVVVNE
ncbi:MAG TPA: hypothetical protein VFH53_00835 [Phycisphaerae bacterium]|nr:hypothetical protein [Phycisphaerae bacterium]